MSRFPTSHLGALREGVALFLRHPALALGLAVLAMVLTQVGPALELAAGVSSFLAQPLFAFAGLLPLEMYFIPRLQARLDAELRPAPGRAEGEWRGAFDRRWARAFLLRLGLSLLIALGLLLFVIPGVLVLAIFGWAPLRLLIRGDAPVAALRWSQAAMARHWPRVVQAVLAMALVAMLYQVAAGWSLGRLVPAAAGELGADAWLRLKHPAFWAFGLLGGIVNVWLSCALLALYHRLETAVADASPDQSSSVK
ncbi:hypothetical protein [Geothrix sp. 21YS21S-4]|uniref:hypothetical protein n=1 Tax=Geothrix sp. 21YS21S-4 TaxID=3068889 RepID=UPI0027BACDEA|nr:hypothetical protein [Geothrix sp. 21YS21S-4]